MDPLRRLRTRGARRGSACGRTQRRAGELRGRVVAISLIALRPALGGRLRPDGDRQRPGSRKRAKGRGLRPGGRARPTDGISDGGEAAGARAAAAETVETTEPEEVEPEYEELEPESKKPNPNTSNRNPNTSKPNPNTSNRNRPRSSPASRERRKPSGSFACFGGIATVHVRGTATGRDGRGRGRARPSAAAGGPRPPLPLPPRQRAVPAERRCPRDRCRRAPLLLRGRGRGSDGPACSAAGWSTRRWSARSSARATASRSPRTATGPLPGRLPASDSPQPASGRAPSAAGAGSPSTREPAR